MKKISVLFFILLFFSCQLISQQLGISGSLVGYFQKYKDVKYTDNYNYASRNIGHVGNFSPGFRIEGNFIFPGYTIPIPGFDGLGFTYFFPLVDSAVYNAELKSGSPVEVLGTTKTNLVHFSVRFAYEIPQSFNDFLLLHIGWGGGYLHYKTENILPEKSTNFPFDKSDFNEETFVPVKNGNLAAEIFGGGIYEFEHFSIMAQYSAIFHFRSEPNETVRFRHGFTVGIFYPLKKNNK